MQGPVLTLRALMEATGLSWAAEIVWDDARQCDPHAAVASTCSAGPRYLLTGRGLLASGMLPSGDVWWFMASSDPELVQAQASPQQDGYALMEVMSAPWDNSPVWAREMLACGHTASELVELPY
jgi:hypothetical protein